MALVAMFKNPAGSSPSIASKSLFICVQSLVSFLTEDDSSRFESSISSRSDPQSL